MFSGGYFHGSNEVAHQLRGLLFVKFQRNDATHGLSNQRDFAGIPWIGSQSEPSHRPGRYSFHWCGHIEPLCGASLNRTLWNADVPSIWRIISESPLSVEFVLRRKR